MSGESTDVIDLNDIQASRYFTDIREDPKTGKLALLVRLNGGAEELNDITAKLLHAAKTVLPGPWGAKILGKLGIVTYDNHAAFQIRAEDAPTTAYWVSHGHAGVCRERILDDYQEILKNGF